MRLLILCAILSVILTASWASPVKNLVRDSSSSESSESSEETKEPKIIIKDEEKDNSSESQEDEEEKQQKNNIIENKQEEENSSESNEEEVEIAIAAKIKGEDDKSSEEVKSTRKNKLQTVTNMQQKKVKRSFRDADYMSNTNNHLKVKDEGSIKYEKYLKLKRLRRTLESLIFSDVSPEQQRLKRHNNEGHNISSEEHSSEENHHEGHDHAAHAAHEHSQLPASQKLADAPAESAPKSQDPAARRRRSAVSSEEKSSEENSDENGHKHSGHEGHDHSSHVGHDHSAHAGHEGHDHSGHTAHEHSELPAPQKPADAPAESAPKPEDLAKSETVRRKRSIYDLEAVSSARRCRRDDHSSEEKSSEETSDEKGHKHFGHEGHDHSSHVGHDHSAHAGHEGHDHTAHAAHEHSELPAPQKPADAPAESAPKPEDLAKSETARRKRSIDDLEAVSSARRRRRDAHSSEENSSEETSDEKGHKHSGHEGHDHSSHVGHDHLAHAGHEGHDHSAHAGHEHSELPAPQKPSDAPAESAPKPEDLAKSKIARRKRSMEDLEGVSSEEERRRSALSSEEKSSEEKADEGQRHAVHDHLSHVKTVSSEGIVAPIEQDLNEVFIYSKENPNPKENLTDDQLLNIEYIIANVKLMEKSNESTNTDEDYARGCGTIDGSNENSKEDNETY